MSLPATLHSPRPRWFEPLWRRYGPLVEAACARLPEPWSAGVPRAGLGGAVVAHVARTWGRRRWGELGRVAVVAAETLNRRVWTEPPDEATRTRWLGAEVTRLERAWDRLRREDEAGVRRVLTRLLDVPSDLADHEVPEGVLFLRGAVVAGVLAGAVSDPVHERLDRWATWTGLAWEAEQGTLDRARWRGGLHAIGIQIPYRPEQAVRRAHRELASLPGARDLALAPRREPGRRPVSAWIPRSAPLVVDRPSADAVEQALADLVGSDAGCLDRTARFLRGQGGKRLRPRLVLAAARAVGGDPDCALLPAALVEWLHQASLILDDIVDDGRLRRGLPALHVATDTPFALGAAGWLLSRIYQASETLPDPLRRTLLDTATALAAGQHEELRHTGDDGMDLTRYYRIIEGKTARLFACAARLGGAAAGAGEEHQRTLFEVGKQLGLAFQIVDDLLDYLGDEALLGKSPGADWRAGKVTLPLLLVSDRSGSFDDLVERMRREGVGQACLSRARTHRDRALVGISSLPDPEGRRALEALVVRCVERTR